VKARAGRAAAGFTLVEVAVSAGVLAVAIVGLVASVAAGAKQSGLAADMAIAVEAARRQAEVMAAQDFKTLFAVYNAEPTDDPYGDGTAAGPYFLRPSATRGLDPAGRSLPDRSLQPRAGQDWIGQVIFPCPAGLPGRLTEQAYNEGLGMTYPPGRDLNGNGVRSNTNVASSYKLLPVQLHLEWRGRYGDASYDLYVLLADRAGGK
jgi:hypothetical protein